LEISNDIRANVEVHDERKAAIRHLDIEQVRAFSMIVLRLESLCSQASASSSQGNGQGQGQGQISSQGQQPPSLTSPTSPTVPPNADHRMSKMPSGSGGLSQNVHGAGAGLAPGSGGLMVPPAHLGPVIRDEMTDEDLVVIIESLTTRAENCMSTLVSDTSASIIGFKLQGGWTYADAVVPQTPRWFRFRHGCSGTGYQDRREFVGACYGVDEREATVVQVKCAGRIGSGKRLE
jgi:hypothetical protein